MRITQEELKDIFYYLPDTGELVWKHTGENVKAGDIAGKAYQNGYKYISVAGIYYPAALLVWIFITGEDTEGVIDHIDLNKANDRFENLRPATNSQNHANRPPPSHNQSGFKGVFWNNQKRKWNARLMFEGKQIHIGFFADLKEAVKAHREKAIELWGEFALVPSDLEIDLIIQKMDEPITVNVNAEDLGL